ncbi:hypothetical protein S7711_10669 [Stachybotrys chartarum IBT 7711]|uniref:Uncharacterized protein n=1 Tax=Stachybotrys chartarum (strain CBS 109288 / IBT 7711) TaxID=1280523 RepID=A0A084B8C3_STACB|nr:hypothetical protein S7711_10669 [Stachybotrys chartarum IBT 7711]
MHPDVVAEFIGPRWLCVLASSLAAGEHGINTVDDAMNLCYALADEEFDLPGTARWEDLPRALRSWLQGQDGLKVQGEPAKSMSDLLEIHGLVLKKPVVVETDLQVSTTKIFMQIVTRYYRLIAWAARGSSINSLTVYGTEPMPRKCSRCRSRLLDDPFPRFKKMDEERYVAHVLKRGCDSDACQANQGLGFAIPWDDEVVWAQSKAKILRRPKMKADWVDVMLRQGLSLAGLPDALHIICRACKDPASVQKDEEPRWTIETTPRYVTRKPRCKVCSRKDTAWCPVNPDIAWLDPAAISKVWQKKEKHNWDIDDMVRNPELYFPKSREERNATQAARRRQRKRTIRYQT